MLFQLFYILFEIFVVQPPFDGVGISFLIEDRFHFRFYTQLDIQFVEHIIYGIGDTEAAIFRAGKIESNHLAIVIHNHRTGITAVAELSAL